MKKVTIIDSFESYGTDMINNRPNRFLDAGFSKEELEEIRKNYIYPWENEEGTVEYHLIKEFYNPNVCGKSKQIGVLKTINSGKYIIVGSNGYKEIKQPKEEKPMRKVKITDRSESYLVFLLDDSKPFLDAGFSENELKEIEDDYMYPGMGQNFYLVREFFHPTANGDGEQIGILKSTKGHTVMGSGGYEEIKESSPKPGSIITVYRVYERPTVPSEWKVSCAFYSKEAAEEFVKNDSTKRRVSEGKAIVAEDRESYLLTHKVYSSTNLLLREEALKKLTDKEKEVLGLTSAKEKEAEENLDKNLNFI